MKLRDILRTALSARPDHANVASDVNAVVAANIGERGATRVASHRRTTKIVQSGGRTDVSQSAEEETTEGGST